MELLYKLKVANQISDFEFNKRKYNIILKEIKK